MSLAIHKTSVPTNNKRITPGSINGCRIAVKNDSEFVVACNNELFYLTVDLKEAAEQFSHDSRSQISKFIPIATPLKQETKLTATHPYEIQNIFYKSANGQDYLYSVDMAGNSKFHILENSQIKNTVSVSQSETKRPELGWCGIIPTVHDAEKVFYFTATIIRLQSRRNNADLFRLSQRVSSTRRLQLPIKTVLLELSNPSSILLKLVSCLPWISSASPSTTC